MNKRQSGFTLIEIAIVMVIIGLLLGGVLKGQEMINNSRVRNAISSLDGIAAAIYSYQDRYAALPGDDPNANARWGGLVVDGDGNGLIDGGWTSIASADESAMVWEHLRQAGLITGAPITAADSMVPPTHPFGGVFGVEEAGGGSGGDNDTGIASGIIICMNNMAAEFGEILDRNLDDGDGILGDVQNDGPDAIYGVQAGTVYIVCKTL